MSQHRHQCRCQDLPWERSWEYRGEDQREPGAETDYVEADKREEFVKQVERYCDCGHCEQIHLEVFFDYRSVRTYIEAKSSHGLVLYISLLEDSGIDPIGQEPVVLGHCFQLCSTSSSTNQNPIKRSALPVWYSQLLVNFLFEWPTIQLVTPKRVISASYPSN